MSMATVVRPSRRHRAYVVRFADHQGVRRQVPAYRDRIASGGLAAKIVSLVQARGAGNPPPPELLPWLGRMPPDLRRRLEAMDLIDPRSRLPSDLPGLVADFEAAILAKGRTAAHARVTRRLIERYLEDCPDIRTPAAVTARAVQTVCRRRQADLGWSLSRCNHLIRAIKSFATFLRRHHRIRMDLDDLDLYAEATDPRRRRRALSLEEARWLLACGPDLPQRAGVTGAERALVYRVAMETGLRASELASLTRASFHLDGLPGSAAGAAVVRVEAAASKRRRADLLPLSADLAAALAPALAGLAPAAAALRMVNRFRLAAVLGDDLAQARAAWLQRSDPGRRGSDSDSDFCLSPDRQGRVVDFHALRHTRGVWLADAGLGPRAIQDLMRLSSLALVQRYTQSFEVSEADLARIPSLGPPETPAPAPGSARGMARGSARGKAAGA